MKKIENEKKTENELFDDFEFIDLDENKHALDDTVIVKRKTKKTQQREKEQEVFFVTPADVLYFESVDNRTYLYTEDEVMEIKKRLYELEFLLSDKDFIRISKSQIVNINKIKSLKPELNRTILATMCNGEQLSISRKYVQSIRKMLSI